MVQYFQRDSLKGEDMAYKTDQLKQLHKQKIKDMFFQYKKLNKKFLANNTGISQTTCTTILKELLEERFIFQIENIASTGGRPSKQYQLNKDYQHNCLVHLKNGKPIKVEIQIRNLYSEILLYEIQEIETFSKGKFYDLLDDIFAKDNNISTIALSVPGIINENSRVLFSDIEGLAEINPEILLAERYHVNVIVENDVNLAVVGYHTDEKSLAFLYQPKLKYTGCGIMLNHCLYRGSSLFAGEVGFLANCAGLEARDYESGWELLINQLTALICVLNPEMIVVHSCYSFHVEEIYGRLKEYIAIQHIPRIQMVKELDTYIFEGLMEASVEIQRNHFKVEEIRKV